MDKKEIKSILQEALEEEIPSSQVQLWPAVKASLVAGESHLNQQGIDMYTIKSQRTPRLAFAFLMVVALIVIALATPQGRSIAQSVLQFFRIAENTTFPLDDSQIVSNAPEALQPTAMPPAPLISAAEAEAQVGFDAAELPYLPEGFEYLGARLYGNVINLEYETQGKGGHLIIQQSPDGFNQSDWDNVPAEAIIPVMVGELEGEFVQGTFVVYPGETLATWNPEAAIFRLRWLQNDIWFEIAKYGNVEEIEYLDQAGLIELAESLVFKP
jgi:hypothetical protein